MGFHIGPLPTTDVTFLDADNVVDPSKIIISRSINKNFYNTILYKWEEDVLEEDKFHRGVFDDDEDAKNQVMVGIKALVIPAKGFRDEFSGTSLANSSALRRLKRYKIGAEFIDNMQVFLGDSFRVELGDIVLLDLASLKISDTKNASREGKPRLLA